MLKIGDEATMPAFTENLRGASPEESREFEVTYPEDYDRKTLAGRTVRFKATVKAVRRKELPELNDEFAKDLGDYQTLDELKDAIRKSILHEREHQAQDDAKHQIIDKLVDTHRFRGARCLRRPADRGQRSKTSCSSWRRRASIRDRSSWTGRRFANRRRTGPSGT